MDNNQSSFHQFSDQLRLQTTNFSNLSVNDSIWSTSYVSKRPEDRRNFDLRVGGEVNLGSSSKNYVNSYASLGSVAEGQLGQRVKSMVNSDYTLFNGNQWKLGNVSPYTDSGIGVNGGFNKGIYQNSPVDYDYGKVGGNKNVYLGGKYGKNVKNDEGKNGKKSKNNKEIKKEKDGESNGVDKRFKTLPASESLPRNETIGGYIFVCNNDTMAENLKRQLFGLPPRYRDSVRAITPGLPLFLYNYSTHQLHGIFEAATFGGTNIDPTAWEDKKNPGESRFPAQVCLVLLVGRANRKPARKSIRNRTGYGPDPNLDPGSETDPDQ
ncbi:hypothetical protein LIER_43727 [Lithospermum erythrorhizon]|uniref:DCD domain-containing protein n=1 Tax=Lithospermum erythrorhizon TaxID=34254 RepID=A0AAV3QPM7_LITER